MILQHAIVHYQQTYDEVSECCLLLLYQIRIIIIQ